MKRWKTEIEEGLSLGYIPKIYTYKKGNKTFISEISFSKTLPDRINGISYAVPFFQQKQLRIIEKILKDNKVANYGN